MEWFSLAQLVTDVLGSHTYLVLISESQVGCMHELAMMTSLSSELEIPTLYKDLTYIPTYTVWFITY